MKKALVLGGYGLIGAACVDALRGQNLTIVGMGRSEAMASRVHPEIEWIIADIARLTVAEWRSHLVGVDVIINASGALQDGAGDDVSTIHDVAVKRLCEAAKGRDTTFVQISAAGVSETASTAFFRSKFCGDAHIQASSFNWVILRPTLVIGPNAYGGTALLRGVAGFPGIGVRVFDESPIQTIHLNELALAVADCVEGYVPMRQIYDLTETESRSFAETVSIVRNWLGFSPFSFRVPIPKPAIVLSGWIADGLGWLGWRSPLRTTAMRTISEGVVGDPKPWDAAGGRAFSALPDTLNSFRATLQDRWFARLYLLLPISLGFLSVFWLLSGGIGLLRFDQAVDVLSIRGLAPSFAKFAVLGGSIADILLGLGFLYRPMAKLACAGAIVLSFGYVLGSFAFAADLWLDPLGPMVKVLPSIGLTLITYAMLEER